MSLGPKTWSEGAGVDDFKKARQIDLKEFADEDNLLAKDSVHRGTYLTHENAVPDMVSVISSNEGTNDSELDYTTHSIKVTDAKLGLSSSAEEADKTTIDGPLTDSEGSVFPTYNTEYFLNENVQKRSTKPHTSFETSTSDSELDDTTHSVEATTMSDDFSGKGSTDAKLGLSSSAEDANKSTIGGPLTDSEGSVFPINNTDYFLNKNVQKRTTKPHRTFKTSTSDYTTHSVEATTISNDFLVNGSTDAKLGLSSSAEDVDKSTIDGSLTDSDRIVFPTYNVQKPHTTFKTSTSDSELNYTTHSVEATTMSNAFPVKSSTDAKLDLSSSAEEAENITIDGPLSDSDRIVFPTYNVQKRSTKLHTTFETSTSALSTKEICTTDLSSELDDSNIETNSKSDSTTENQFETGSTTANNSETDSTVDEIFSSEYVESTTASTTVKSETESDNVSNVPLVQDAPTNVLPPRHSCTLLRGGSPVCSCVLIKSHFALTTCLNCLKSVDEEYVAEDFELKYGYPVGRTEVHVKSIFVQEISPHPNCFNQKRIHQPNYNIGLVQTDKVGLGPLDYAFLPPTTSIRWNVQQAQLSSLEIENEDQTSLREVYWHVVTKVIRKGVCKQVLGKDDLPQEQYCVSYQHQKDGACADDIGMGLFVPEGSKNYVVGILSKKLECGLPKSVASCIKVVDFVKWINAEISKFRRQ